MNEANVYMSSEPQKGENVLSGLSILASLLDWRK